MNYAIFRCCPTSGFLKQYETSTDAVLNKLDVDFVEIKEFGCCGYPLRNISLEAYALCSARNLAIARQRQVNLLTVCDCCYGAMKHVQQILKEDTSLRNKIDVSLSAEGLYYDDDVKVKHFLEFLYEEIGLEKLKVKITKRFDGLKIAAHYGCHILRPRTIVKFDDPFNPSKFDELVEVTGAQSILWTTKLECCGASLLGSDTDLAKKLAKNKINDAKTSGADYLCVTCVYCQLQFDQTQEIIPSILFTQLLGLCLGIDGNVLGVNIPACASS
ncbi:MAG: CoB--CoM heterodisulfide reductase iron-sulfur subunit B family protein [Pseudomonadota bacterium]